MNTPPGTTAAAVAVVDAKPAPLKRSSSSWWSPEEDEELRRLVEVHGAHHWSTIASQLPGRIGKQCRERWANHLCPGVRKAEWTEEEDRLIFEGVSELGHKWSEIAKRVPGRTDNAIKNRFNSRQRKEKRRELREAAGKPCLKRRKSGERGEEMARETGEAASEPEAEGSPPSRQLQGAQRRRIITLAKQLAEHGASASASTASPSSSGDEDVQDRLILRLMDETMAFGEVPAESPPKKGPAAAQLRAFDLERDLADLIASSDWLATYSSELPTHESSEPPPTPLCSALIDTFIPPPAS